MFIVASFSIVGGLRASMDKLEGSFSSDYYLVTRASESGLAPFNLSEVASSLDRCASGYFVDVTLDVTSSSAAVFCLEDDGDPLFPYITQPVANEVYVPNGLDFGLFNVTSQVEEAQVEVAGILSSDQFPGDWILGTRGLVDSLSGLLGVANFALTDSISGDQRAHLESEGFSVQSMTGIIDFLGLSVDQVEKDMVIILLPASFVIAVLSYGFVGSETADKRHDIGILKTIGTGRARLLRLLLSNALLIALWGGALGLAFGIVLSYAISTAASSVFMSVFLMDIDPLLLALAFVSTVAAGLVGAIIPSLRMTMSSPVSDLREGMQ
jgi:ABC-type antimicrobial peptide transport system permease subunit